MKITDNMIKSVCSQTIYKRGVNYFREGRVHLRKRSEHLINAVVDGDEVYNIQVKFSENAITSYICTCPYYQTMDAMCKHIVAALKQRQAELEEGGTLSDDNDRIAEALCSGYSALHTTKELLYPSFTLTVQKSTPCPTYNVSMSFSPTGARLQGIENFLECYINKKEFIVDKHTLYSPTTTEFGKHQTAIIDILAESYENRNSSYYTKSVYQTAVGEKTVSRLMPYLEKVEFNLVIDLFNMKGINVREENPDILIDINSSDEEIIIEVTERGFAITRDGEWFLYENEIYHTTKSWRNYFMPIYSALNSESRTYISFRGPNRINFATEVLPEIRGKHGVITQGIDDIIVDEKPEFEIYFDGRGNNISAVVIVRYGSIPIKLMGESAYMDKIVVRDYDAENNIMSHFSNFEYIDGNLILSDDADIYDFITLEIPILKLKAKLIVSESFKRISITNNVGISVTASYNRESRLLEAGFDTELPIEQIFGILRAVKLKKRYYRLQNGSFLDIIHCKENRLLTLLDYLDFDKEDLKRGYKVLPMYQALYLDSIDEVEKSDDFRMLLETVHSIAPVYPLHLDNILRDYQKDGTAWMKQLSALGLGGILADDMGLGKTLQVIAFVMGEHVQKPALIVTPSSLIYNWFNEINRFTPEARVLIIDGAKEERAKLISQIREHDFVITSYPMLRRDSIYYKDTEFSYCFIDEAQYIKNPKTMNARSVKNVNARIRFALTGTPIENSLMELWSIFDFVMQGYLYGAHDFKQRFEVPVVKNMDNAAANELRSKIRPFVLRRMKQEVLEELPEKIENTVYADLVPEQKRLYAAYLATARKETAELLQNGEKMLVLTLLMRLRQICCHPALFDENYKKDSGKLNALIDIVTGAIASNHRVLIFSQFTSMLAIIRRKFSSMGIKSFYIDGQTKPYERTELADRFNKGENSVFLISLKAGGTGLNLIGADTVIHYDPWWNPAVMDQASDRAYRIGQTRAVQVIRLAASGTIEEKILRLQESKRTLADDIIKMNNDSLSSLSNDEILSLFE